MPTKIPTAEDQTLSPETQKTLSDRPLEENVPLERKNKILLILGTALTFVISLTAIGIFFLKDRLINEEIGEPLVYEEETVPAPQKELARGEFSLEIINGTGISGEAGRVAKIFEELGYRNIKVGNTALIAGSKLAIDKNRRGMLNILLTDVGSELEISGVSENIELEGFDGRILLGK